MAARDFTVAQLKPLAEDGNELAQFELGNMYGNGRGVTQDYAEAMKWFRLAAEQGIAYSLRTKSIRDARIRAMSDAAKLKTKDYRIHCAPWK